VEVCAALVDGSGALDLMEVGVALADLGGAVRGGGRGGEGERERRFRVYKEAPGFRLGPRERVRRFRAYKRTRSELAPLI